MAQSQRRPCQPRPVEGDVARSSVAARPRSAATSRAARTALTPTIAYNSCRNRHCPKCQGAAARHWLAERETELLPVGYFHLVFTLPAPIADIAYQNKAVIYDFLFKACGRDVITIAADPKHLGARSALSPCSTPGVRQ